MLAARFSLLFLVAVSCSSERGPEETQTEETLIDAERDAHFSRASILQESNVMFSTFRGLIAGDAGPARIYHRALSDEVLEDDEAVRFHGYLDMYFAWVETFLNHLPTDLLFAEFKDMSEMDTPLKPYILKVLRTKVGASWWQSELTRANFTPSLIQLIDTFLRESEEVVDTAMISRTTEGSGIDGSQLQRWWGAALTQTDQNRPNAVPRHHCSEA